MVGLRRHEHIITAVSGYSIGGSNGKGASNAFAGFHRLKREVLSHRVRDGIAVLSRLHALLGEELDLRPSSPNEVSQPIANCLPLPWRQTYLFWNQICTERSVILMSCAMRSRTAAVGVGFLLNSTSRVTS